MLNFRKISARYQVIAGGATHTLFSCISKSNAGSCILQMVFHVGNLTGFFIDGLPATAAISCKLSCNPHRTPQQKSTMLRARIAGNEIQREGNRTVSGQNKTIPKSIPSIGTLFCGTVLMLGKCQDLLH